jgi:uncharacterized protein with beta-barrel porin domain
MNNIFSVIGTQKNNLENPYHRQSIRMLFAFLFCIMASTPSYAEITAADDRVSTQQNKSITIAVLSNDQAFDEGKTAIPPSSVCLYGGQSPCNMDELSVTELLTPPMHGTIALSSDLRSVIYTPETDYVGTDSFVYAAYLSPYDSGLSPEASAANVTITITAPAEPSSEQIELETAFGSLCDNAPPSDSEDDSALSIACAAFSGLSDAEKSLAYASLSGDQVATQFTSTVSMARDQNANIGSRLSQLRNNSSGMSVRGLTLNTESGKLNGEWLHAIYDSMSRGTNDDQSQTGGSAGADARNTNYSPFGFFINGSITVGEKDSSTNERGYELDSDNYTFGLDYRLDDAMVVGMAYGYSSSEIEFNSTGDDMENSLNNLFVYSSWFKNNLYLSGTLGYAFGELDTARRIVIGGFNQIAKGSTDTSQILLQVTGSYDVSDGALSYGPYMKLDIIEGEIDSYAETNGGGFGIAFESQDISSQLLTLGAQAQYALGYSWGVLLPSTRFEIKNEFNDSGEAIRGRFALDPNSTAFSITADKVDSLWFQLGAGVSAVFQHGLSAYLDFETTQGLDDLSLYTYSFGGRWELAF